MKKGESSRYALFAGAQYYPSGGWNDFYAFYASIRDAEAFLEIYQNSEEEWSLPDPEKSTQVRHVDWWHIVDMETGLIVSE